MTMTADETWPAGRVALVTGAAGGIGLAAVRGLARAGFQVAAADLERQPRDRLGGQDAPARVYQLDVRQRQQVARVAAEVEEEMGPVEVLVNSAGVFAATPVVGMPEQAMQNILDVNLAGALRCMAEVGARMAGRGSGRMINIASISGITGAALGAAYAASKAGLIAASRSAARELAPRGVVVTAVAPGFCDTPMLDANRGLVERFVVPRIPVGRVARSEEVAEVVCFLATCKTPYLTGGVVTMDGGLTSG